MTVIVLRSIRYYPLQRHWTKKIMPHLTDKKLNATLVKTSTSSHGGGGGSDSRPAKHPSSSNHATGGVSIADDGLRIGLMSNTRPAIGSSIFLSSWRSSSSRSDNGALSRLTSTLPFGTVKTRCLILIFKL